MKTRKCFSRNVQKGISLIEAIVTIAVYATLSVVAVQKLGGSSASAQSTVQSNLVSVLQDAYSANTAQANSGAGGGTVIANCTDLGAQLAYGLQGYTISTDTLSNCAAGATGTVHCSCTLTPPSGTPVTFTVSY